MKYLGFITLLFCFTSNAQLKQEPQTTAPSYLKFDVSKTNLEKPIIFMELPKTERSLYDYLFLIMPIVVAFSSLVVSYASFKRDSGKLSVAIFLGSIMGNGSSVPILSFKITNVGRRQLTLNGLHGYKKWQYFKRICLYLFGYRTPSWLSPTALLWTSPQISAAMMPNGQNKVLKEGEEVSIIFLGEEHITMTKNIYENAGALFVYDSIGNRHFVPRQTMSMFRYYAKERLRI